MNPVEKKIRAGRGGFALSLFMCFLSAGALLFLPVNGRIAHAQTTPSNDLQIRMNRIENEIQTLSRAIFRGESPPAEMISSMQADQASRADVERRLDAIENDLRTLTGKIEEQGFTTNMLSQKLEKNLVDIGMRLDALERQSAPISGPETPPSAESFPPQVPSAPQPATPGPESFAPVQETPHILGQITQSPQTPSPPVGQTSSQDDPATQYEQAFTALRSGDYAVAGTQFEAFLARNPGHALAPNAQYWLGESYYARKEYEKAARTFAEAYQKYPKSSKTPDNLLKLAMSLAAMGNKKDACVAFAQLHHEYPDGTGPVLARATQEMTKLGCP